MIVGFLIWSVCALVLVVVGIITRRSQNAAGFFTGVKPPKVSDVKGYNRAVSNLWFIGAVIFEILGLPLLFLKQNSPGFLISIILTPFWAIGLAVVYFRILAKYTKKEG